MVRCPRRQRQIRRVRDKQNVSSNLLTELIVVLHVECRAQQQFVGHRGSCSPPAVWTSLQSGLYIPIRDGVAAGTRRC